jgi:hypothetical protein
MTRRSDPPFSWLDGLILVLTLAAAGYAGSRNPVKFEEDLSLTPLQAFIDNISAPGAWGRMVKVEPLRDRYARAYPYSPIAWVNQIPGIPKVERWLARFSVSAMGFLSVASLGVGFVVIRGANPRRRWGPGRVASALAMGFCGVTLATEFVMRRFDLEKHGDLHFGIAGVWAEVTQACGMMILASWLLLGLTGRWRLGRGGWREWLGLALGVAWLATFAWQALLEPVTQLSS